MQNGRNNSIKYFKYIFENYADIDIDAKWYFPIPVDSTADCYQTLMVK